MTEDQLREVRRCHQALGQVLLLAAMPKKTEAALQQVYSRLGNTFLQVTDKSKPQWQQSVTEGNTDGLGTRQ